MQAYQVASIKEHEERKNHRAIMIDLLRRALYSVSDSFPIEVPKTDPIHQKEAQKGSTNYAHEQLSAFRKVIHDHLIYLGYNVPQRLLDKLLSDRISKDNDEMNPVLFDDELENAMQELLILLEWQEERAKTIQVTTVNRTAWLVL